MDISQITDYLYVGVEPRAENADELEALGIRLFISMIGHRRPPQRFREPPFHLVWLRTFDTFFTPILVRTLARGVNAALPVIQQGDKVLSYCARGCHRSAAMGAAILIAMGYSAEEAMQLLRVQRPKANPYLWYIRRQIKRFELAWRSRHPHAGPGKHVETYSRHHQPSGG